MWSLVFSLLSEEKKNWCYLMQWGMCFIYAFQDGNQHIFHSRCITTSIWHIEWSGLDGAGLLLASTFARSQSFEHFPLESPKISYLWNAYLHIRGSHSAIHCCCSRIHTTSRTLSAAGNLFYILDSAFMSTVTTLINTCNNFLLCCKSTWNKPFC